MARKITPNNQIYSVKEVDQNQLYLIITIPTNKNLNKVFIIFYIHSYLI